jgi:hypothetical protein
VNESQMNCAGARREELNSRIRMLSMIVFSRIIIEHVKIAQRSAGICATGIAASILAAAFPGLSRRNGDRLMRKPGLMIKTEGSDRQVRSKGHESISVRGLLDGNALKKPLLRR